MTKLAWMPFYGADFFEDEFVRTLSREEQLLYIRLLWHQWREGSIPADENDLRAILGLGVVIDEQQVPAEEHPELMEWVRLRFEVLPADSTRLRNLKLEGLRVKHLARHRGQVLGGKRSAKARRRSHIGSDFEHASKTAQSIFEGASNKAGGESEESQRQYLSSGSPDAHGATPPARRGRSASPSEQDADEAAIMARFQERKREVTRR